ncbi:MAG: hypothetical protein ACOX6M_03565 [Armatimonadota bacterium]
MNVSNYPDADDTSPSLSADGRTVAWLSWRDRDAEVYIANTNAPGALMNVSAFIGAEDKDPSLQGN